MLTTTFAIFLGICLVFFALAKLRARPGFDAFALGICLAATPFFARYVPLAPGAGRDLLTVALFLLVATLGTVAGGGLKPREGDDHHHHPHEH